MHNSPINCILKIFSNKYIIIRQKVAETHMAKKLVINSSILWFFFYSSNWLIILNSCFGNRKSTNKTFWILSKYYLPFLSMFYRYKGRWDPDETIWICFDSVRFYPHYLLWNYFFFSNFYIDHLQFFMLNHWL